jgi:hypothetical protein
MEIQSFIHQEPFDLSIGGADQAASSWTEISSGVLHWSHLFNEIEASAMDRPMKIATGDCDCDADCIESFLCLLCSIILENQFPAMSSSRNTNRRR